MTADEEKELMALLGLEDRIDDAKTLDFSKATREESNQTYAKILEDKNKYAEIHLCKTDLFYLLTVALKRKDVNCDWLYGRCREVCKAPDGYLDLWARDHYKSTIITYAKTIQDILCDPEIVIGIFSHTRPIAKAFLGQIKQELETNEYLQDLFPDVLYKKPQSESPKWSLDSGLTVKRKTNPKEATVEAWGLVDGQPTSKHYTHQIYDDVVTQASVTTPDQIHKTTDALSLSFNLGSGDRTKRRFIGTRYHLNDTYRAIMERNIAIPRIKPATDNGKMPPEGKSVFLSEESLLKKRNDQGSYVFSCQLLQNPIADKAMTFKEEWLMYYETLGDTSKWNKYLLIDPASAKKASSDYTVMAVIGLAPDNNYYLLDAVRDRLNLTQRAKKVFELHRQYQPNNVGYEKYGIQADVEHIQYMMEQNNYRFHITELGGSTPKEDRIKKLIPAFEQKRFYLPKRLIFVDGENVTRDFVKLFIENEFLSFPVCVHDDMFDCIARIMDQNLSAEFPKITTTKHKKDNNYGGLSSWMG